MAGLFDGDLLILSLPKEKLDADQSAEALAKADSSKTSFYSTLTIKVAVKFGKSNGDRKRTFVLSANRRIELRSNFFESLILAQDERWRRALSMQVERELCVAQRVYKVESL